MSKNWTRTRWFWGAVGIVGLGLGVALGLDLRFRGLMWQAFYQVTGEEHPLAQLIALPRWASQVFRAQPNTDRFTPIQLTGTQPFGINVFLEQEVEPAKREQSLQMIQAAGFEWLRQEFPWEDIEIHAKGDFTDRRNDRNLDGVIDQADAVSAWDKYDHIVSLVEAYDLQLLVRLSNPPDWVHADPAIGDKAPPDNLQDYLDYVRAVAERYQGRIHYYQVWNEPNIYPEWGNQAPDPVAYTAMLCQAYDLLKQIDPSNVVMSGPLAPTNALGGVDLNDFVFLQRMFDNGAGECFDILSMQGYGLNSGATDRRMRPQHVNFARNVYIRDLMVRNGFAHKPIWMSEAAWNPVPEPSVNPNIDGRYNYGQVTEEQAARYMVTAYERMQREWNWTGVMFYWYFKRPADYEVNQSWYYFRMVEPDFTPLPIYAAMQDYIHTLTPTLYQGTHQADHWAIHYPVAPVTRSLTGAQFVEATQTTEATFTADGTAFTVRVQGQPTLRQGDRVLTGNVQPQSDDWQLIKVTLGGYTQRHEITLVGEQPFALDAVTVFDHTLRNLSIVAGAVMLAFLALVGWRLRRPRR